MPYYGDKPSLSNDDANIFFHDNNTSVLFKFREKLTGKTRDDVAKDFEIMVPLKYLSNFWRTLDMLLTNCEVNIILTWSANCIISSNTTAIQATKFAITGTKRYVTVLTLSTNNNAKLLQQLKSGFRRTINWNKYQPKVRVQRQNQFFDELIDPSFQGVNKLFVLSFEDNTLRTVKYLESETEYYNVTID